MKITKNGGEAQGKGGGESKRVGREGEGGSEERGGMDRGGKGCEVKEKRGRSRRRMEWRKKGGQL